MPPALSTKQQEVLQFVRDEAARHQAFPTVREVMQFLGVRTPRGAESHLKALVRKGYLLHHPKTSRAYRIPPLALASNSQPDRPPMGEESNSSTGQCTTVAEWSGDACIPIVGRAPGGFPSAQEQEDLGELHLPLRVSKRAYAIRVIGDSMRDAHIIDGDVAVVDPDLEAIDRAVVLALIGGEYTIKVLRITPSTWWLEAANELYPPIMPNIQFDRVEGPVVALFRKAIGRRLRAGSW